MDTSSPHRSPEPSRLEPVLIILGTVLERSWPPVAVNRLVGDAVRRRQQRPQAASRSTSTGVVPPAPATSAVVSDRQPHPITLSPITSTVGSGIAQ